MISNMLDKHLHKLSLYRPKSIIIFGTIFVVLSSIPLVYILTMLFGAQYTNITFIKSIVTPLLMAPVTIGIIIELSVHLKYFKDELNKEIEKNKKKDAILFEQARFALMGEMLANISHQWKQPLNTISLSVANAKLSSGNNLEKNFDIIESNVNYLASTIDDFMSFFNKKTYTQIRDLKDILKEVKSIINIEIIKNDITLDIEVDCVNNKIELSSSISQVLLNLLNNAKDAFDKDMQDKRIILKFTVKQESLEIICCDSAGGINPEIKNKIFDPYFTTKHKSQGTGIGLYMSKQIVQKIFGGNINFDSESSCFCINLPYSNQCMLKKRNIIDDS
ncbi:HAMP domain-containing sensor histidine kinase [Sulfurimonas sp.]|uniref:sensor histidine kinase n=1 Tax=Sulfurimonas sp. TaxID=2022749 RepID=UPI002B4643C4|nr:HAMP domain-containing sensor histidine kinase [Sulfurimonas sp.]